MSMDEYIKLEGTKAYIAELVNKSDVKNRAYSLLDETDFELIAKVVHGVYNELDNFETQEDRESYIVDYFILANAAQQASFKVALRRLLDKS